MNHIKIPGYDGYLQLFNPKLFLQWSVDQWGFWQVELLDIE